MRAPGPQDPVSDIQNPGARTDGPRCGRTGLGRLRVKRMRRLRTPPVEYRYSVNMYPRCLRVRGGDQ